MKRNFFSRTASLILAIVMSAAVIQAPQIRVLADDTPPEIAGAVSVWDLESTPEDLSGWLSDLYGILWGSSSYATSAGYLAPSVVSGKGTDGSKALAWTQVKNEWGNSSLVEFSKDTTAVTDWSSSDNLYLWMDASEVGKQVKMEIYLYQGEVIRMSESTIGIWENGAWKDVSVNQWSEFTVPDSYVGWIKLPLGDVYRDRTLSGVERIGIMAEHDVENVSVYFDSFCIDGTETDPQPQSGVESETASASPVWNLENMPDSFDGWIVDRFVELGWRNPGEVGFGAGNWTVAAADGRGLGGSRALEWTMVNDTWGNSSFVCFANDRTAVTDWSGAQTLYVYADTSSVTSASMTLELILYVGGEGTKAMTPDSVYYVQDGNSWTERRVSQWNQMTVPFAFKGWIKFPLSSVYGAASYKDVQRIGFLMEHVNAGDRICFDHFCVDRLDSARSFDPTELETKKTGTDLIPDSAQYSSEDYFCTWNTQASVSGHGLTVRDVLTDAALFGENGWAYQYDPEIRRDMYIVLDDGWDLGVSADGHDDEGSYGSFILDETKFPGYGESYAERLATLASKIKAAGWKGTGVWVCCQEDAAHISADGYDADYWRERIDWCRQAGITYWKVDWGKYCYNVSWRQFITDAAREIYPELVIEHISGDVGTNDPLGTGRVLQKLAAMERIAAFSDVFRTYDVTVQLSAATTFDRVAMLLNGANDIYTTGKGLMNCEDEVYMAAALGLTAGVMRSTYTGGSFDEVTRAILWHRLAPSFDIGAYRSSLSDKLLTDSWTFNNDTWDSGINHRTVNQTAPAAVGRGIAVPVAVSDGEIPFAAASRNALTGAISIGTFRRTSDGSSNHLVYADVTLDAGPLTGPVGIFGVYGSLTLGFDGSLEGKKVLAQDLIGEAAYDITDFVTVDGGSITIQGDLLKYIGTSAASLNDSSEPGLVLQIGESADYAPIPASDKKAGTITSAGIEIAETITLDIYAQMNTVLTPSMKITAGSRTGTVKGVKTDGVWKFSFAGINPQCMTENIRAELMAGGVTADVLDGFTIEGYCGSLYDAADTDRLTKTLLADLLVYGAEAQKLTGYRIDDLSGDFPWIADNRTDFRDITLAPVREAWSDDPSAARFASVALSLANDVKAIFKMSCADASGLKLRYGIGPGDTFEMEEAVAMPASASGGTVSEITLGGLCASDLQKVFKVEILSGDKVIAGLLYNVDSYIEKMHTDTVFGGLIEALACYGHSALAYANAQ